MSHEETETRVEGSYLIVSTLSVNDHATNPLEDDDYAGKIYGNFNQSSGRSEWSSIGEEHEFRAARGLLGYSGNRYEDVEIEDYLEQAAVLAVLETPFDEALEVVEEHFEFEEAERLDEKAFRAQVHKLFAQHVMEQHNASWPKLPTALKEQIDERARILARQALEARVVGDKYAVPLSIGGYYSMELKLDSGTAFSEMTESGILWVPSEHQRAELDALPYDEAMKLAVEHAKSDAEQYAEWASGNVFDIEVKAYLMERDDDDDDGDPIEEADHYQNAEAVWEEDVHHYIGRDYAEKEMASIVERAVEHVVGLEAALTAAKPSSGASMSM